MPVRSVEDRTPRPPVIGKIRLGVYDGKRPRTSDTFVFTSPDAYYLTPLAKMWGGAVERFVPQGQTESQWRLVTDTREIVCLLPFSEGRLNLEQWRELYGSGHIKRRCDEDIAQVYTEPEGHLEPEPCVCNAKGKLECDLVTRLRCWIPSAGLGVWELQSRSVNAAFSLPDDLGLIEAYFGADLNRVPVSLTMVPRKTTRLDPKTNRRVPATVTIVSIRLALPFTDATRMLSEGVHPAELMTGGGRPALGPGPDSASAGDADEQPGPNTPGREGGSPLPSAPGDNVPGEVDTTLTGKGVRSAPPADNVAGESSRTEPGGDAAASESWPDERPPAPPATPTTCPGFVGENTNGPCQRVIDGERCGLLWEGHRDQGRRTV